jgi:hypothetical protein
MMQALALFLNLYGPLGSAKTVFRSRERGLELEFGWEGPGNHAPSRQTRVGGGEVDAALLLVPSRLTNVDDRECISYVIDKTGCYKEALKALPTH